MKSKILIIHEILQGGGAEKVLIDILKNFDYKIYDVTLLLIYKSGVYVDQIPREVRVLSMFDKGVSLFHCICTKFSLFKLRNLYFKTIINHVLKNERFDTIISFMEGYSCVMHDLVRERSKRNISWVHTDLKINNWCLNAFKSIDEQEQIYKKMDDVIFVSEGARDAFNLMFQAQRTTVIHNLINVQDIVKKSELVTVQKTKFTVVNVGRLADQKRQERIVEVAKILKTRGCDIEYWILGTGPRESELKNLVHKEGLDNIVIFKGFQSNPYPFIKAADLFLLTSQTEGYPLVVCEAISLGKPIVSTKVTGTKELLADGVGLLCDYDSIDLSNAVEKLYHNSDLLQFYSNRAKAKSLDFDVLCTMNEIYRVINNG